LFIVCVLIRFVLIIVKQQYRDVETLHPKWEFICLDVFLHGYAAGILLSSEPTYSLVDLVSQSVSRDCYDGSLRLAGLRDNRLNLITVIRAKGGQAHVATPHSSV
jgi:hypothetical protein